MEGWEGVVMEGWERVMVEGWKRVMVEGWWWREKMDGRGVL